MNALLILFYSIYLNNYNSTKNHELISLILTMGINGKSACIKSVIYEKWERSLFKMPN